MSLRNPVLLVLHSWSDLHAVKSCPLNFPSFPFQAPCAILSYPSRMTSQRGPHTLLDSSPPSLPRALRYHVQRWSIPRARHCPGSFLQLVQLKGRCPMRRVLFSVFLVVAQRHCGSVECLAGVYQLGGSYEKA